ncbi:large-conductance mechanosensitive channel protein MscL [Candidatus Saccharibacteria bacterium]|nr:large-conductance mechanosensitive channel protein MscL [Candidatus Saccharibacteria bacterium]
MSAEKTKKNPKELIKKARGKSSGFRKEFTDFINRGNVMDLAVGIIIGSAFTAIVTSIVNDIIMPLISLVGGGFNFTTLSVTIPNLFGGEGGATIAYGNFIQNVINFLIIALVIFLIIKAINKFHRKKDEAPEEAPKEDENTILLREIRDALKKKK